MEMPDITALFAPLMNFWVLVAIAATLTTVQMFKAVLKHYGKGRLDDFTMKLCIFVFAFIAGYYLTNFFVADPDVDKWAVLIALLNPAIYEGLLIYATKKQMIGVLAVLKMRPLVQRDGVDRLVDEANRTVMIRRQDDK